MSGKENTTRVTSAARNRVNVVLQADVIMASFMSDVKNKTEETHLLLNTHARSKVHFFAKIKYNNCPESLLEPTKIYCYCSSKGKRDSRS